MGCVELRLRLATVSNSLRTFLSLLRNEEDELIANGTTTDSGCVVDSGCQIMKCSLYIHHHCLCNKTYLPCTPCRCKKGSEGRGWIASMSYLAHWLQHNKDFARENVRICEFLLTLCVSV